MTPITTSGRRYGAYHRISRTNGRDFEAENTMSDKDAFERIEAWATMSGATITDRYLDTDESGSKLTRPELDRLLADLDAGIIDGIVVAQVDRLSRADVGDALTVVRRIVGDNKDRPRPLVLLDLGIDPSTEFGEFGLTILLGLARMQWRRYKRTWATAQTRAVARGVWIGPAPFGYRHTVAGYDRHDKPITGPLEPDPARAEIVRQAFRIAAADGLHAVMAYLRREVPEKRWRTDEVRRLLRCRAYLGELIGGHAGPQEPLTTPELFAAAQTEPRSRRDSDSYPLSGLASCERCDGSMVGGWQTTPDGRRYRRMRCSTCNRTSISADRFEAHVRDHMRRYLTDTDYELKMVVGDLRAAEAALVLAKGERRRFAKDTRARDLLGDEDWYAGCEERGGAVLAAQSHYDAIARGNAQASALPGPDKLDDNSALIRAVTILGADIVVRAGRGLVGERVTIAFPDDGDDDAGMLAA